MQAHAAAEARADVEREKHRDVRQQRAAALRHGRHARAVRRQLSGDRRMNKPVERHLIAVGAPRHGGIFLGNLFVGLAESFELIKAPKAEGEIVLPWNSSKKNVNGALSVYDGLANTKAMA